MILNESLLRTDSEVLYLLFFTTLNLQLFYNFYNLINGFIVYEVTQNSLETQKKYDNKRFMKI